MSWPDFEQYLRVVPADITNKTIANTLELAGPLVKITSESADDSKTADDSESADDSSPVRAADLANLRVALLGMEKLQVVYVSSLFALTESGQLCVPHCNYDSVQAGMTQTLTKFESKNGCYPFRGHFLPKWPRL